ncbi:MAG TPA: LysM peptidoglycan-binding domain-containing protein [Lachnospiraceae bacterium]|nr:LysM peptidoglycan-binding domain-containing protein [Lachnospiraceae bacterium]
MTIHVVKPGETIQSIADSYGITPARLIQDNGITIPIELVPGQTLVIVMPEITYTVKEGDTLSDIANSYQITIMELYRNNPYLSDRQYIYPGDELIIKYSRKGNMVVHGHTYPFLNKDVLKKTLPYLTYLSIINYTASKEGEIKIYSDDTEVIQLAKEYGVMPLMLLTTLTVQGEPNISLAYEILLNEDFRNRHIDNILVLLKQKGYYGVNISLQYINESNLKLYETFFTSVADRIINEGYLVFVTINPNISYNNNIVQFDKVNLTFLNKATNIIFMRYEWATTSNPPGPVFSVNSMDKYLDYATDYLSPDSIVIGMPAFGYNWELPYIPNTSKVSSLDVSRALELAKSVGATIFFDELSQTPYFYYTVTDTFSLQQHIVWFMDARSIQSLLYLEDYYYLIGTGIWNIAFYNPQLWLLINSQYVIEKVLDEMII